MGLEPLSVRNRLPWKLGTPPPQPVAARRQGLVLESKQSVYQFLVNGGQRREVTNFLTR